MSLNIIKKYLPIIILLILILIFLLNYINLYSNFLTGLWVCDDDFCIKSGINQMILYIGKDNVYCNKKVCVIIVDNEDNIYQFIFYMIYNPLLKKIFITNCENNEDLIFPNKMNAILCINSGTLILSDKDQDYAHLYKDNINNN